MSHPLEWTVEGPCPSCGSWDITEYEMRLGGSDVRMSWECRECGHLASWRTHASTEPEPAGKRQVLSVMPLHAITAMYGEQGLRDPFALEIRRLADPATRSRVEAALRLAGQLHDGDLRQREPYVNHPLRVALRIVVHCGVWEPDVICAALLHDALEDHAEDLSASGRPGAYARLATHYGARVAELVAAVTNPVYAAGSDADRQYREHVRDSLDGCPWARVIKLSDFTDNGVGIVHTTGAKAVRLARKYAPLVPALAELTTRADTPLTDEVKVRILAQLDSAARRFEVIDAASSESD
jgi:hypothetical protein